MAHSQIVCAYTVTAAGNQAIAALAARFAAIPLELGTLQLVGLVPSADSTATTGNAATRTITLKMGSSYSSAAGFMLTHGSAQGPILGYAPPGSVNTDYPATPVVQVTDNPGPGFGAKLGIAMGIGGFHILSGGSGYSAATKCTVSTPPGGVAAVLTPVIALGVITGITIVSPGSGYATFEQVVVTDSGGGSGAEIFSTLTPVSGAVYSGGSSYASPLATYVTAFQESFPDANAAAQAAAVIGWMSGIFSQQLQSPVTEAAPVVS
jgi:hypothetical protein